MAETMIELIREGKDITITLTESEKAKLEACEQVIKKGLNTFLEVGHALGEIRDNRLYRETHKDWQKYCKEVWDLTKRYADMQIQAHETVCLIESKWEQLFPFSETSTEEPLPENQENCTGCVWKKALANKTKGVKIPGEYGKCTLPGGLCEKHTPAEKIEVAGPQEIILPINEAQTRPLTKLKNPDDQVKAWGIVLQKLNENPKAKLTAALISKAVKEVKGDVVKRKIDTTKKAVDATSLLSRQFKVQFQVMMDIIDAEKNNEWVTSKRKEVIKWLSTLVKIAESDD